MRLFLSSQDLGHHAELALEMCGPNRRLAYIMNAADDGLVEERSTKLERKRLQFEEAGFTFTELDLRDYFGKPEELEVFLHDFDFVWANGGNTFILRRAMRSSGFDTIIKKRLEEDTIMYGGSSAGSCVCAPTLHGIDKGDRPSPDEVPAGYPSKDIIWEGLDLVPFMIMPHCDQEWFKDSADESIESLEEQGLSYVALNDGEVVIVDGAETRVLRPEHELSRYRPVAQLPYCCVPASLQMVLRKNDLPTPKQELIGAELGLVVPPEFADKFENVEVRDEPVVGSGFGTRIQDPNYGLEKLITKMNWPFAFSRKLSSGISSEAELQDLLAGIEARNGDALICYQNDRGFGHVVVFDRIADGKVHILDPSPLHEKWRAMDLSDVYQRIKAHGDAHSGGLWLLERV